MLRGEIKTNYIGGWIESLVSLKTQLRYMNLFYFNLKCGIRSCFTAGDYDLPQAQERPCAVPAADSLTVGTVERV